MNDVQVSQLGLQSESETGVDPELADILETYLTALEQGTAPRREEFLARHASYVTELARYLPWVELLYEAKPRDTASATNPPMPDRLGDFRLVRELGRGGMGIVYEAEQLSLARRVALKVLPFASMLDERQLARFKNEALAAAQLQHPRIVPIYAVGHERGLHFYVMQLIEGETLEHLINRPAAESQSADSTGRPFAASTVHGSPAAFAHFRQYARWIAQAAEALDYAHNQGIVHRDVKPSNLMLDHDGDLWVADFGLARTGRDATMTASGELLGTLRYMSPEQLRSKPGIVDHRTDIYSLGLTLFELVAGRPAFDGQTQQELMRQIEHDELPSLARLNSHVPRDLESILLKATAKAPEARYASAQELADDLRALLDGRPTLARPATWRDSCDKWIRRHARLVASAALALVLVLACALASEVLVWQAQSETRQALRLASENHERAEANLEDARQAVDELFTGVAGDLAEVPGSENVRRKMLDQALAYYQKFIAQAATNAEVCLETAAAYYRCGQISEQLGDDNAASTAYEAAKGICATLCADAAEQASLETLALCENNLGLIHLRAGRHQEAEVSLRRAMEIAETIRVQHPDDAAAKCRLALSYANLGMAIGQQGRHSEARDALHKAIELQASAGSSSALARGDLAATYNQLGYLCSSSSVAEAEAAYRQAADEFARLSEDEPAVLRWQAQRAAALNNLAALAAQAGRIEEAESDYRRAIEIQRQLVERAPQVAAHLRDLAVSQNNFGYLLSRQNRHAAAVEQFEGAQASLSRLARAHGESPEYASRLGAVLNNLGLAFESQGSVEPARRAFSEAIQWQRKALSMSPDWREARDSLEAHAANLRRLLAASDNADDAITAKD
jgi:serine/threonine protein kinase/Tfp pilus assembly protein PilF